MEDDVSLVTVGAEVSVAIDVVVTVVLTTEVSGVEKLALKCVVDSFPLKSELLLPLEPVQDLLCLCVPPLAITSRTSSILITDRLILSCIISAVPFFFAFSSSIAKFKISSSYWTNKFDLSTNVCSTALVFAPPYPSMHHTVVQYLRWQYLSGLLFLVSIEKRLFHFFWPFHLPSVKMKSVWQSLPCGNSCL